MLFMCTYPVTLLAQLVLNRSVLIFFQTRRERCLLVLTEPFADCAGSVFQTLPVIGRLRAKAFEERTELFPALRSGGNNAQATGHTRSGLFALELRRGVTQPVAVRNRRWSRWSR